MASEPLIRVTGLRKTFGNHRVLDGLDLDVHAGEAVAWYRSNGLPVLENIRRAP